MENRKLDSQTLLWYGMEILFKSMLSLPAIENYVTYFVSFLLFIQIAFFQTYEPDELVEIVLISLLIIVITINSNEFYIMSSWLFILAFRDADLDKVVKIAYKLLTIGIMLIVGLSVIGAIPDRILYRGMTVRHSMGFSHPNQFGLAVFQWVLCRCYLRWHILRPMDYILLGIIAFAVHRIADSQTAVVCILMVLMFTLFSKTMEYFDIRYEFLLYKVCTCGSIIFMVGSLILTWIDVKQYPFFRLFDLLMSARFSVCHQILKLYGSTFLGQPIYVGNAARTMLGITYDTYMDNAYVTLWMRYGLIFALLFIVVYIAQYKLFREFPKVTMVLFIFSIYGIMESGLYQLYHNIFVLLFAYLLYQEKPWPESFFVLEQSEEDITEQEFQSRMSL